MPRLPVLSWKQVCRILASNGLTEQRAGAHVTCIDPKDPTRRASVPRHDELKQGTLASIIKHARKDRQEFIHLATRL